MHRGVIIDNDIDSPVMLQVIRSITPLPLAGPLPDDMSKLLGTLDAATRTPPGPSDPAIP